MKMMRELELQSDYSLNEVKYKAFSTYLSAKVMMMVFVSC